MREFEEIATMKLSCGLVPGPEIVEQARLAESLGYARVWTFDSPALYGDLFIALARVGENTERIGLGTAVLVPSTRNVLTAASAIASIEQLAPGRLEVAVGTGFTARALFGKRPLSWKTTGTWISQLRGLLRGEQVEVEGQLTQMIHPAKCAPPRPIETPILVAANGPKGLEVARKIGDGIMCINTPQPGFGHCALLAYGTVMDEGESFDTARVFEAIAPGIAVAYHGTWQAAGEAVDALPGGKAWREEIEAVPEAARHLAVHQGHMVELSELDRRHISPALGTMTFSGTRDTLRARIAELESQGMSELVWTPCGPDIERELHAMAQVLQS
ncbi:MAG: LLM class flavin-dependent oxidoreductase [Deltaproteobacteria bacterium]|nr:LLM class flavin-dependent oxidoreductase [Deltaproteobacteria bacterium]